MGNVSGMSGNLVGANRLGAGSACNGVFLNGGNTSKSKRSTINNSSNNHAGTTTIPLGNLGSSATRCINSHIKKNLSLISIKQGGNGGGCSTQCNVQTGGRTSGIDGSMICGNCS
jgi:hypothetical protein